MSDLNTANGGLTDQGINGVDDAVAAAKAKVAARKAAKAGTSADGAATSTTEGEKKRKTYTPEERIQRAQQLEADRAKRAADRKAVSEAKKAEQAQTRGTPHMSKVEKAAAGLASMDEATQSLFDEIKGALGQTQIDTLLAHLAFHSRRSATEGSLEVKLEVGQRVRIISGPAKLIGKEGVVEKAQRIHCYIGIGAAKPAYLFNYNVEVLPAEAPAGEPEAPASGEQAAEEQVAA